MIYTQIRAFDAVAREGSFSRAAEVLGVTQPALTIQVKALEERYGMKLLHRDGRRVRLTDVGERLYSISRQFASLEELVEETLSPSQELQHGSLRLAVDGPHIVMGLFARYMRLHPGVQLSVATGNSRFVRQELLDRHVDVAILPGISEHPKVHAVPLWRHRGVAIVSNDHPWSRRDSISLTEFHDQPMIGREEGSMTQALVDQAFATAGVEPRYVLELGSREALCEAVAAGLGHGIIWELEAYGSGRFKAIPIAGDPVVSTDYVACLKSERMRMVVRSFFSVAATLPGPPYEVAQLRR